MLKKLRTKDLHEILSRHGINLAKTPVWQRRGILIYKELHQKLVENHMVTRRKIVEEWALPRFKSTEGQELIQKVIEQAKPL